VGQALFHSDSTVVPRIIVAHSPLERCAVLEAANMSVRCCHGDHIGSPVTFKIKCLSKAGSLLCVVWPCVL